MTIGEAIFWTAVLAFIATMILTGYGLLLLIPVAFFAMMWMLGWV